jgi:hypothetical protein
MNCGLGSPVVVQGCAKRTAACDLQETIRRHLQLASTRASTCSWATTEWAEILSFFSAGNRHRRMARFMPFKESEISPAMRRVTDQRITEGS